MTISRFIILVHNDRAPVLLGPMSESVRIEHMRELRARHQQAGLHELDIAASGCDQVEVSINPCPVEVES